ncbi:hypothetical protein StoSoilB13_24110 [Arthrobacter sp. StoSoilB13]|nr:hypothetical protein StoSoilB13_24110 [Arthrobacter sp. StoSoilB13]
MPLLSTTICPALDDATFISAPAAAGLDIASVLGDMEVGAVEEVAAVGAVVDVVLVPGLPAQPARATAKTTAPSPTLSLFLIFSSFDGPAGMGRR